MAHNFIFGLLGKKLGGSLTPIDMVLLTGLVPWIQMETQVKPTEADLEGLTADLEELITAPVGTRSAGARPSVEVQKLVMVTKTWYPYFLSPQPPW